MDATLYEDLEAAVKREARLAESRWNNLISAEDIEQEIWLWLLERPGVQNQLENANAAELSAVFKKSADQICSKERLDYDHFTGNYHYISKDVRALLETQGEEYDVHSADEKVDLQLGKEELEQYHYDYFEALERAYLYGDMPENNTPEQRVMYRAVDKLTELMNRKRGQRERDRTEGLGTKPKISSISEDDSTNYYKED